MSWRWNTKSALILLHGESLATHGGGEGLRDVGLLDSALTRLLNLVPCADVNAPPDVAALSASYTAGLAKTSPFIDGSKRAAFLATSLFLCLNSYRLEASQADATITMRAVDTGDITEDVFANWLRLHIHIKLLKQAFNPMNTSATSYQKRIKRYFRTQSA